MAFAFRNELIESEGYGGSGGLLKEEITTILAKMRYLHQIDQEIKVHLLEQ